MGSLMSCLKGHDEGIEDDHSGNENSTHNQRYYLLRKCTSLFGPMRSIGFSSNQEPPSSSPNEAAENSESNTAPASPLLLSFPPAANSSHSYSEIVRTAIQQGGSLDYKEKPKKSKDDSSVSLDECPTCLEEYSDENPKIIAKCSHHYHLGCIYDWMERSTTCPICRKLMVFDEGAWHI